MSTPDLFVSEIAPDEIAAGFTVCHVANPEPPAPGRQPTVPAVVHSWGDPSHRLIKTHGRNGLVVFQLQAFGRSRARAGPLAWFAERYWPGHYGPVWVIDRLREHIDRAEYQALIDLHVPSQDEEWPNPPEGSGMTTSGPVAVSG
jgi:hypothetical protein